LKTKLPSVSYDTFNNIDIVKYCQSCFDFEMPSDLWIKRTIKLNDKILQCGK